MSDEKEKYAGEFTDAYTPQEAELRARKSRNIWLGLALAGFVILVGVVTFIRLSSSDLSQSGFYYSVDDKGERINDLPEGMTPDQAAPPPNLTPIDETQPEEGEP
ncbi:MAG: hypothetical protein JJ954_12450 [Hyphomonas sp.]|uniref:hypothetical protein n=1 Tax=Hyphomonas sp. TaxID=87 RepID=UPI001B123DBA|nr:hypothetical protein [Hyphomonas sp.]MBO6583757.1 hypothetical protein [Hyphomonas sp.]